tara:strand:- start:53 stop:445 length:393 start_codon:yes stop_codon:yes gene_type:complete
MGMASKRLTPRANTQNKNNQMTNSAPISLFQKKGFETSDSYDYLAVTALENAINYLRSCAGSFDADHVWEHAECQLENLVYKTKIDNKWYTPEFADKWTPEMRDAVDAEGKTYKEAWSRVRKYISALGLN